MSFTDTQLKLLSTKRGLQLLLSDDEPNFKEVAQKLTYLRELVGLQAELIKLQNWVVEHNKRILILVEGREYAGKGEAVRIFTDHLNPQHMRLVALEKPTQKESAQWYFKRYIEQIPEAGEMVFFDRSWYNRALVEPVHGFCTDKEYKRFMNEVNHFERMLSEDGILIIKFFFTISKKVQHDRIEAVRSNPLKQWQLTKVDREAVDLYDKYTTYKKAMFHKTDTKENPWCRIDADNLQKAIIKAFNVILKEIPYNN